MCNVLVVCNDLDYFFRHRATVPEYLAQAGCKVTVVAGGRQAPADQTFPYDLVHMPIERFSFRLLADMGIVLKSLLLFLRVRPDAVHLITLKPAVYSGMAAVIARALGFGPKRILITIPGLGRLMSPSALTSSRKASLSRRLVKRAIKFIAARRYAHFTFETAHDRNLWVNDGLITVENSSVINGAGVDPIRFFPRTDEHVQPPLKILFASRLLKSKGLEAFLLAAEKFAGNTAVDFLVAGMVEPNDPDGYPLAELAKNPWISFLGEVTDMPSLLREADIVCLPTLYGEGIPRILIEAAACAVPAVATDVSGCRDIVVNGGTGVLIATGPLDSMAGDITAAVQAYLSDTQLLRRHRDGAYAHFNAGDFSQDSVTQRFVDLLGGVPD